MRGVVLTAPERLELRELPEPVPGPGEQLVRVEVAGICGTDLHGYRGRNPLLSLPRVPGHELAGTVIGGDGPVAVGTRVCANPMITCGECRPCRIGRRNCCVDMKVLGVHVDGALCEVMALPASMLHPLPENVSLEAGALVEPLSIGANACLRGDVGAGDTVLVQGAGPIGLCAMLMAKVRGARTIVTDALPGRLTLAERLGADVTIDVSAGDETAAILALTDGEGPAVVIEATGRVAVLRRAFDLVAAAGVVVTLVISPDELSLPVTATMIRKELDFRGSRLNRDLFPEVLGLLSAGKLDPLPMVTHRFGLEASPEAFALALERPNEVGKVLVRAPAG